MIKIKDILNLEKIQEFQSQELQKLQEPNGTIRLLTAGKFNGYTNHKMDGLQNGEILAISIGGKFNVKYHKGFYYSANNYIFTGKDGVDLQFMRYYFINYYDKFQELYQGWGIAKFNLKQFLEYSINLPSIKIQKEIVRILDALTTHTAELTERKKQYEYYRNQLLNFEEKVEWKKLGEVCEVQRGSRLTKKELSDEYQYPVFHGGLIPLGYYNQCNRKANQTMIINTGSIGEVVWSGVDFWSSDGTFVIKTPKEIDDKFLYFFLKRNESYFKSQKREGGVPTINREAINTLLIPIPPLSVQKEIVEILDALTTHTAELTTEHTTRSKQYEYYRDKLLNFEL